MSRISVTSRELTAFLSEQLAPELTTSGFRISADGSEVVVTSPDGTVSRNGTAAILEDIDDERGVDERASTAARAVLGHVQDVVSTATGQPWPDGEQNLPLPDAGVAHGALTAWFGDAHSPAWRSAELPLGR